ncbi:hypothetical protein PSCICO_15210 [Pseudomonas cichorii]|uniref:hypothetical protein n=1 Tax=Pseudomonas cichorii TaxID=36746 RepID=UPI0019110397|nr:hypothetical protein [Pseudomonas cichorii]GFM86122.1 hypothetical protein PSCICO_15210 [Pseudomonas cichorii]
MGNAVVIRAELAPAEATALLKLLKASYSLALAEHWYDDAYRTVNNQERHTVILMKNPAMAAQKRLIGALAHSLKTVK